MIGHCESCRREFTCKPSDRQRFCSRSCAARAQMTGRKNPRYNGGFSTLSDGRTVICCRDGSVVPFYRAVIEAEIGRHLRPSELVHHLNGDPTDDRRENLELTTRSEHIGLHRKELEIARGIRQEVAA